MEGDYATFPDVTLCDLQSQSNGVYDTQTSKEFMRPLNESISSKNFSDYMKEHYPSLKYDVNLAITKINSRQQSPGIIWVNSILQKNFSFSYEQIPIIDCQFINWDYTQNQNSNCLASVKQVWDPDYAVCYTMRVNSSQRQNVRALSAIVYLENISKYSKKHFHLKNIKNSQVTSGIRVLTHAPCTQPAMKSGIDCGAGSVTTIVLEQTKQTRLPAPYTDCTTQKTLGPGDEFNPYTGESCVDACIQQQYVNKCGCLSNSFHFTYKQMEESNFSDCKFVQATSDNSSLNFKQAGQLLCYYAFSPDNSACSKGCLPACEVYKYSTNVNSAPWPEPTILSSLYDTYIKDHSRFGGKYDQYRPLYYESKQNISAYLDHLQQLYKEGLFQANFLQLTIQLNYNIYTIQKDVAAFPLDALGAQVGGVLSLWLGVTVMLIFEIFEFIINLQYEYYKLKRIQKSSAMDVVL